MAKKKSMAVVVCTEKKGVFFGYCEDELADPMTLTDARMCVYWSADVKGVLGLASVGPSGNCRVSPKVPEILLREITCVMKCTDEARDKWEKSPWS